MTKAALVSSFYELAADVNKTANALHYRAHEQIKLTVAIDVREDSSTHIRKMIRQPGRDGFVSKFPIPDISEEPRSAFDPARKNIRRTIAIIIPQRQTGPVLDNPIPRNRHFRNDVREIHASLLRGQKLKTRGLAAEIPQLSPARVLFLMPFGGVQEGTAQRKQCDGKNAMRFHWIDAGARQSW
jgi:hypothetical protein